MKAYCSYCGAADVPLIAAPAGEVAFICCECVQSCLVLFIENLQSQKEKADNEGIRALQV